MGKFILFTMLTLIFFSCGIETEIDETSPTSFNILSQDDLNALRDDSPKIETKNVTLGRLINFDDFWSSYPGSDYTAAEAKALIGGRVDADWITNTCAIRLSRGLNYSDNEIDRDSYNLYAGQTISGADGKWYGFRVAEMNKYLLHHYGTPINLQKNITVTQDNVYSEDNARETERLEERAKALGIKGILMFNVHLWNDATGHLEPWNGYHVKAHEYFTKAQEVFVWTMEEMPKCGGVICAENEVCLQDSCEIKCGDTVCQDDNERCIDNQCVMNGCYMSQDCNGVSEICQNNVCVEDDPNRCGNSICNPNTEKCVNSICVQKNGNGDSNGEGTGNDTGTGNPSCNYTGANNSLILSLIFFMFAIVIIRRKEQNR